MSLRVGLVGCGLIGRKRVATLSPGALALCADRERTRASDISSAFGGKVAADWEEVVSSDVDMVIVATTHDCLAEISLGAIRAGKHVLVEKPAARSADELDPVLAAARSSPVSVRVGFNHRYHRALRKAREIVAEGRLGTMMFLRARYGHGGRVGYDKEWRADPTKSGGGELIDQGPHLIDLARCFLGEFTTVEGFAATYFWDMPVDDNAFLTLRTSEGRAAFLHVSCTEWKNTFSMEIYGTDGKLEISGLGGSYGVERLTHYHMLPEMGPPETRSWEYPMADDSWAVEMAEFLRDIESGRSPDPGLVDAHAALTVIDRIYEASGYDFRP